MKFFGVLFSLVAALATVSAGYIGWSSPHYYSRPVVVRRVVYPSSGWSSGWPSSGWSSGWRSGWPSYRKSGWSSGWW
ncbi:unnamed protein product [Plutella xylostella]|uniref:(diamondback moth) hypothetical protein n=1 Tax=Plutella xylostella TaxID=51655 RepID=A0A8S4F3R8_PLUXY|nr:unnamed protein product [Plutella xylostella]